MIEQWCPVPGFNGYEVSDWGRVRSLDRIIMKSNGVQARYRGRILKGETDSGGYRTVNLSQDGKAHPVRVHLLVAMVYLGPRPDGLFVCHGPAGNTDNSVGNLRWDTPTANAHDRLKDGNHQQKNKTHCPRQHKYTPENTRICRRGDGRTFRRCKTCYY